MKNNQGITLIALVITIIVLLILAGVSISAITGENGIVTKASNAKEEMRAASVKDIRDLYFVEKKISNNEESKSLDEVLDELIEQNLITAEERETIEKDGHVQIASKDISFKESIEDLNYTITSSLDVVEFKNTITEANIAFEKPGFTSYTIEGISNSKDGEYISSGSVAGKSGNLEIKGDISNSTFKYNLTNFMLGDEKFYVRVDVDGEKLYQEINVIQGDAVLYENDFAGIKIVDPTDTIITEIETNDNFSNGTATHIKLLTGVSNTEIVRAEFYGRKMDIIVASLSKENYAVTTIKILNQSDSSTVKVIPKIIDWNDETDAPSYDLHIDLDANQIGNYIGSIYMSSTSSERNFWFDALVIYK